MIYMPVTKPMKKESSDFQLKAFRLCKVLNAE